MKDQCFIVPLTMGQICSNLPQNRLSNLHEGGTAFTLEGTSPAAIAAPAYEDPANLAAWTAGFIAAIDSLEAAIEKEK